MSGTRHPYYKYPVVVYRERPPIIGTDGRSAHYRIEMLDGKSFFLRSYEQMMKFLGYHGCYGVTEEDMAEIRKNHPAAMGDEGK